MRTILLLLLSPLIIVFATIVVMAIIGASWMALLKFVVVMLAFTFMIKVIRDNKKGAD